MEYYLHLFILILIYTILVQGLNYNFGLGGIFNLAHVACYSIGAYTTAILSTTYEWSVFPAIIISIILAICLAIFLGVISFRLDLDYFAIGSLALSFVVNSILINYKSLTNGVLGISGIPRPIINHVELNENLQFMYLLLGITFTTLIFFYLLFRSSYSRRLAAQAEFKAGAESLGINCTWQRLFSFMVSAGAAGLAGSLYAYYINFIDPSSFSLQEMFFVFSIIIIGKPGSFWGNLFATAFLILLPEPLRFLEIDPSYLGPARQLIYAVILFATVYFNRYKIFPVARSI